MAPKNIVLCSDGTGNRDTKGRGTNVFKLFEAVDIHGHRDDPNLVRQVAFYSDGVGTAGGRVHQIVTGAMGSGLDHNVKSLYLDLVRAYKPGDKIFVFGFSRGAFTVRTLAGFISTCGVMKLIDEDADREKLLRNVDAAYRYYVSRDPALLQRLAWTSMEERSKNRLDDLRAKHAHYPVQVEFVGVWDTVAALGFPVEVVANWWNRFVSRFKFQHTTVPEHVHCARHAIAIDDARETFQPTLWTEKDGKDVVQVWFAGVHSNVGGGYPKQGMSLVAMDWMMHEAERKGLRFIREVRDLYRSGQNVHDKLYDSRAGLATYYRYRPRSVEKLCAHFGAKVRVHESVLERIALGTQGYAPGNLPRDFELVTYRPNRAPDPLVARLLESWRADPESGSLLRGARPWVFRRVATYWGMFVATLLIAAELIQDTVVAAGPRLREATQHVAAAVAELPGGRGVRGWMSSAIGWVDSVVSTVFTELATFAAWASRTDSLILGLPQVLTSALALVLVALGCYAASLDARRRMLRFFGERWFKHLLAARLVK